MEELTPPKWFCKQCMKFTDHNNIKIDFRGEDSTILIGDCDTCKKSNRNYLPMLKVNPVFGTGTINIT